MDKKSIEANLEMTENVILERMRELIALLRRRHCGYAYSPASFSGRDFGNKVHGVPNLSDIFQDQKKKMKGDPDGDVEWVDNHLFGCDREWCDFRKKDDENQTSRSIVRYAALRNNKVKRN